MRSTYELLVDSDERGPSDDLRLRFEALSQFTPEEKRIAKAVIEGLILKHGAQRLARRESLMEYIVNLHIEHLPERKAQGHPIRPDPGFPGGAMVTPDFPSDPGFLYGFYSTRDTAVIDRRISIATAVPEPPFLVWISTTTPAPLPSIG
ncbi:MAG: hypothetical protein J0L65_09650 [Xanthomonadales bacterium]|nr:hypothetical protein [Xanthomonadales bacterium]